MCISAPLPLIPADSLALLDMEHGSGKASPRSAPSRKSTRAWHCGSGTKMASRAPTEQAEMTLARLAISTLWLATGSVSYREKLSSRSCPKLGRDRQTEGKKERGLN